MRDADGPFLHERRGHWLLRARGPAHWPFKPLSARGSPPLPPLQSPGFRAPPGPELGGAKCDGARWLVVAPASLERSAARPRRTQLPSPEPCTLAAHRLFPSRPPPPAPCVPPAGSPPRHPPHTPERTQCAPHLRARPATLAHFQSSFTKLRLGRARAAPAPELRRQQFPHPQTYTDTPDSDPAPGQGVRHGGRWVPPGGLAPLQGSKHSEVGGGWIKNLTFPASPSDAPQAPSAPRSRDWLPRLPPSSPPLSQIPKSDNPDLGSTGSGGGSWARRKS